VCVRVRGRVRVRVRIRVRARVTSHKKHVSFTELNRWVVRVLWWRVKVTVFSWIRVRVRVRVTG
jgi:hypothetical protein